MAGTSSVYSGLRYALGSGLVDVVVLTPAAAAHTASEVRNAQVRISASPLIEDAQQKY